MAFTTIFQLYHSGQCTYLCFPRSLFTNIPHNIPSKPALATFSLNYHRKMMDSGERRLRRKSSLVEHTHVCGVPTESILFCCCCCCCCCCYHALDPFLWLKGVTSIFFFSHSVFKNLPAQSPQKSS